MLQSVATECAIQTRCALCLERERMNNCTSILDVRGNIMFNLRFNGKTSLLDFD